MYLGVHKNSIKKSIKKAILRFYPTFILYIFVTLVTFIGIYIFHSQLFTVITPAGFYAILAFAVKQIL